MIRLPRLFKLKKLRNIYHLFFIMVALTSCFGPRAARNAPAVSAVKSALQEQVHAWNRGNLEGAMSYYWNDSSMLWVSKGGIQKGYAEVLSDYEKEFADTSKMGYYTYQVLHTEALSTHTVYFVIRWKIERDGKRIMSGTSSQIWKQINKRWVIAAEHAS